MSYITTYSGKHFDPANPDISLIDMKDIAHALSMTCRGNGQVKSFFSVGQHCIHCALEAEARGLSDRVIMACLIHDASESYLSDVPRPFKQILTEYQMYEKKLLDMIYRKFLGSSLTVEEEREVKQIDDDMLYFDLDVLLNERPDGPPPVMRTEFSYEVLPFEKVENTYLELYDRYEKKLKLK